MSDDDPDPVNAPDPHWVPFQVHGIRGLYVPFAGGFVRLIPNTPEALASARNSLRWARAAWQN